MTTRRGRGRSWVAACVLTAAMLVTSGTAGAGHPPASGPPSLEHLDPGGAVDLTIDIPVNVVFVGLEQGSAPKGIDTDAIAANVPASARPVVFQEYWAGDGGDMGIEYRYQLTQVFAGQAFEDALFGFMAADAFGPLRPTAVQAAYSGHPLAAEEVTSNYVLDATRVESWLIENGGDMLGVDTTRPTMFFLNWYGRPDFRFHTYAPFTYQPETDVFAPQWLHNHTIAWGGGVPDVPQIPTSSLGRVWFMDVSAGPDLWTTNWLLDVSDVDGDGLADMRIPPIWEYGTEHWYRPFDNLADDLSAVVRYVGLDLLFTPGPLYDPAISPPLLDDTLEVDLNVFERPTDGQPLDRIFVPEMLRRWRALDPSRSFAVDVEGSAFTPELDRAYSCASSPQPDPRYCRMGELKKTGDALHTQGPLDLLMWATQHENQYLDGRRGEIPVALFDVEADGHLPFLGVSYDQRWNFVWDTPVTRQRRFSPMHTIVHEVGHYLGVRHPFDGYDPERDQTFDVSGDWYFVSLGDESATQMSYLDSQVDFSQFDRDNVARWLLTVRLAAANDILGDVYASPRASSASAELARADELAGVALDRLEDWDLPGASIAARDAYRTVLAAAAKTRVPVEPQSGVSDSNAEGPWWTTDNYADSHLPEPGLRERLVEGMDALR